MQRASGILGKSDPLWQELGTRNVESKEFCPALLLSFIFSVSCACISLLSFSLSPHTHSPQLHLILILFLSGLMAQNVHQPQHLFHYNLPAQTPPPAVSVSSSNFKIPKGKIWSWHSFLEPCHRCLASHRWDPSLDWISDLMGSRFLTHLGEGEWAR